jgi:hypothetical protein
MTSPAQAPFRLTILALAFLLGVQSLWMFVSELVRPAIPGLPVNPQMAAVAADQRNRAVWAARIGAIRGDLWTEAAFTYADFLWPDLATRTSGTSDQARAIIAEALAYAPHQSAVWLLLAGLESHSEPPGSNLTAALRMSYYTGPNELLLMPLRIRLATHSDAAKEDDIQQFIRRDLRIIITREPQLKPSIIAAYGDASAFAKKLIEQVVEETDPSFLQLLRRAPSP